MHHHVFSPEAAAQLLREIGFSIVRQDVKEVDIVTLASKS